MGRLLTRSRVLWAGVGGGDLAIPSPAPAALTGIQAWGLVQPEVANSHVALVATIMGYGRLRVFGADDLESSDTWFTLLDFEADAAAVALQSFGGVATQPTTRIYSDWLPAYLYAAGSPTEATEARFGLTLFGSVAPVITEEIGFSILDPNI